MADSENPSPENNSARQEPAAPRVTAGQMLREARLRAGVTVAKVSADLRVSPAMIDALETGDYEKLAGAPYIRALFVSLSRYLRLDSRDVLQAYSEETGSVTPEVAPVSPYKDDSKTHAKAHKQIFILLLAVLLFVLLLIMGKVNSSSSDEPEPAPAPSSADTLLNIAPAAQNDSLLLDSLGMDSTATDTLPLADTAAVKSAKPDNSKAAATPAKPVAAVAPAEAAKDAKDKDKEAKDAAPAKEPTAVRVRALTDSVFVRVIRAGRRESSRTLAAGESFEIKHGDAVTFITRNSNSVEVSAGGTVVIPDKRRFKVSGSSITY
jgi:cytoskeleton protein RodZ